MRSKVLAQCESFKTQAFHDWWQQWQARLKRNSKPLKSSFCLMRANNPAIIPRNHKVEEALTAAEEHSDFATLQALLEALSKPYEEKTEDTDYRKPPTPEERVTQTFCGT